MSPYLFILCMERLGHAINKLVSEGLWKPITLSKHGPLLSHLFFVDDLLLFAEATEEQIKIILDRLDSFCTIASQKVSLNKSSIAFSTDVDAEVAVRIADISKIPVVPKLDKYLGIPSIMGRVNSSLFQHIIDRIEGRLEGWKAKNLTFAGRTVLSKAVLTSTPVYTLQTTLMPTMMCNNIDKKVRKVLWGDSREQRHVHLIKWEIMTIQKKHGGLGIRSMKEMNVAFMAKLGLRLLTSKDELWAKVLRSKYIKGKTSLDKFSKKNISSNVWQGIIAANTLLKEGLKARVYNGKDSLFWRDKWLGNTPLINTALTIPSFPKSY